MKPAKDLRHPLILLLALFSAEVLAAFELAMLYPALKVMVADFGDVEAVGWVMTAYFLSTAVFAALCGRLGDILGRRWMMLIVISLSIVGSLISGFSSTLLGLIIGRIVQGSAGAIFPLCIGLVRENVKPESIPMFIGILAASLTVTMGLGVFAGGVIVDNFGWRWIFFGGALAGVVAFCAISLCLPKSSQRNDYDRRTNISGGILFAPAIVLLLLAITKAPSWGWLDTSTLACLVAGAVLMTVWIKSELHAEVPLIDVRLLANRQVLLINLGSVVLGLTSFQSMHVWSIVLQQPEATGIGLGASATISGLALLPKTLIALVAGPIAGWLISRYSGRAPMAAGSIVMTAAWTMLIFKHDSIALIAITLTFLGLGMSTFYACIPILIAQSVPMHRTSEASGMMIVIRATAMGIGAQVVAVLLNSSTQAYEGANYPDETALTRVLLYVIAGTVLQLIIALQLKRKD